MILFTLDTDGCARRAAKTAFVYLFVSILCALFGAVYELCSHEVYSFYMIYAFCFPLVGGVLPFSALSLWGRGVYPSAASSGAYHAGVATLTVGSIVRGVLDIYGTTNALSRIYWIAGGCLVLAAVCMAVADIVRSRKATEQPTNRTN